jgi:cytochrome b561
MTKHYLIMQFFIINLMVTLLPRRFLLMQKEKEFLSWKLHFESGFIFFFLLYLFERVRSENGKNLTPTRTVRTAKKIA